MIKKLITYCLIVLLSSFYSCRSDKPIDELQPQINITQNGGVYIINEGNYGWGNASLSYYNYTDNSVVEDLFQPANNRPLGDVFQSMTVFNNKAYLVINNSGKIEVVNPATLVSSDIISGFVSPRYFLPVSNSKAYVSDLNSNTISILNLSANTISGSIPCKGWSEEMILSYGKAFVTNLRSDKLFVINTTTDAIDSIALSYGSSSIKEDKNGKLWVLCAGKSSSNIYPKLHCINPITQQVEASFQFPSLTDSPSHLAINSNLDELYYLTSAGVCKFNINDIALNATPIIGKGSKTFYGLGIDPKDDIIYVADAIDYVQQGIVYRYNTNGTVINQFQAGIIPSGFYFN